MVFAGGRETDAHDLTAGAGTEVAEDSRVGLDGGDEDAVGAAAGDFDDFLDRVGDFGEVDKVFCAVVAGEFVALGPGVDYDRTKPHCRGQLHALDADTAAAAGKYGPCARAQCGGFERGEDGCRGAHDGACHVVGYAVWDERGVSFRRHDVLLVGP